MTSNEHRPTNGTFKSGLVSLVGRTNVGKSTLLNRLVGEKVSIISHKIQTTRNTIRGIKTTETEQIIYLDTPGIFKKTRTQLDQRLKQAAVEGLSQVDLILLLITPFDIDKQENKELFNRLKDKKIPIFLLLNKVDLVKKQELLPIIEDISSKHDFDEIVPISALNGLNVDRLEKRIIDYLPQGALLYDPDIISTANLRFMVSEIIREKVYYLTHKEIPYSTAVRIEDFKEGRKLTRIKAVIYVERDSQKGIVIGKQGARLKRIAVHSRKDIEQLLDTKVYIEFLVKVKKKWRSDDRFLRQLGF